jgi:hypothetical protein
VSDKQQLFARTLKACGWASNRVSDLGSQREQEKGHRTGQHNSQYNVLINATE